tara:strand:+ start:475 stop:576 length:102 start_codon:yes stop_codon:yes gene_type:complete
MNDLKKEYNFGKLGLISGGVILFGVSLYFLLRK